MQDELKTELLKILEQCIEEKAAADLAQNHLGNLRIQEIEQQGQVTTLHGELSVLTRTQDELLESGKPLGDIQQKILEKKKQAEAVAETLNHIHPMIQRARKNVENTQNILSANFLQKVGPLKTKLEAELSALLDEAMDKHDAWDVALEDIGKETGIELHPGTMPTTLRPICPRIYPLVENAILKV